MQPRTSLMALGLIAQPGTALTDVATAACEDDTTWKDDWSYTCSEYEANEWCANGKVIEPNYEGFGAEEHCCACGKPAVVVDELQKPWRADYTLGF